MPFFGGHVIDCNVWVSILEPTKQKLRQRYEHKFITIQKTNLSLAKRAEVRASAKLLCNSLVVMLSLPRHNAVRREITMLTVPACYTVSEICFVL